MYQVMVQFEPFKPHTYCSDCFGGSLRKPDFWKNRTYATDIYCRVR